MKNKLIIIFFGIVFLLFFTNHFAFSQPGDPGEDPFAVPIDGGLVWLILAALGLGVKKIIQKKNQ